MRNPSGFCGMFSVSNSDFAFTFAASAELVGYSRFSVSVAIVPVSAFNRNSATSPFRKIQGRHLIGAMRKGTF